LFNFFLHHLPPAEDPILQFLLQNEGPVKKPRSFSGIEAETMFAKPLFAKKRNYAIPLLVYLALFANPVESIFDTSFLVQILALAIF
jgi:hypothetical protein